MFPFETWNLEMFLPLTSDFSCTFVPAGGGPNKMTLKILGLWSRKYSFITINYVILITWNELTENGKVCKLLYETFMILNQELWDKIVVLVEEGPYTIDCYDYTMFSKKVTHSSAVKLADLLISSLPCCMRLLLHVADCLPVSCSGDIWSGKILNMKFMRN